MQAGSNCALPNLAVLDKRAKLNVNKQLEQTKNSLQVISIIVIVIFLRRYCCNEFVECLVLFIRTQEINMGINQP